jgi:Holliday junction resolvasome RuvABC endonuclease subunit
MEIIEKAIFQKNEYSVTEVRIKPPFPNISDDHVRFGVDPGTTKLGLAFLWRSSCHIYEVHIKRNPDPVVRILLTQEILQNCFTMFDYAPLMVIEGSSFANNYRQVELAEVRASAVLWAIPHGIVVRIIPPMSIRKRVFGNAKLRAEVEWDMRDYPNAASALACAYAYYSTLV